MKHGENCKRENKHNPRGFSAKCIHKNLEKRTRKISAQPNKDQQCKKKRNKDQQ